MVWKHNKMWLVSITECGDWKNQNVAWKHNKMWLGSITKCGDWNISQNYIWHLTCEVFEVEKLWFCISLISIYKMNLRPNYQFCFNLRFDPSDTLQWVRRFKTGKEAHPQRKPHHIQANHIQNSHIQTNHIQANKERQITYRQTTHRKGQLLHCSTAWLGGQDLP